MNEPIPAMPDSPTIAGSNLGNSVSGNAEANPQAKSVAWRDHLPIEYRSHAAFAHISDLGALAKEHIHLQSLIGKKGVVIPSANDAPETWDRFYKDLGRPDKPGGYEFKRPEAIPEQFYDQELSGRFADWAHAAGLTAKQAQSLHDAYAAEAAKAANSELLSAEHNVQAAETLLRQEWGPEFTAKMALAERAINLGGEELKQNIRSSTLRNDPAFIAWVAKLGERLAEHKLVDGLSGNGTMSPQEARQAIAKLDGEAVSGGRHHPANDVLHPEHFSWSQKRRQLFAMAYPEA